jgi:hypothetical protein
MWRKGAGSPWCGLLSFVKAPPFVPEPLCLQISLPKGGGCLDPTFTRPLSYLGSDFPSDLSEDSPPFAVSGKTLLRSGRGDGGSGWPQFPRPFPGREEEGGESRFEFFTRSELDSEHKLCKVFWCLTQLYSTISFLFVFFVFLKA